MSKRKKNREFNIPAPAGLELKTKLIIGGVFVAVALLSAGLSYLVTARHFSDLMTEVKPMRENSNYKFIKPLLTYNSPGDGVSFGEYKPMKDKVQSIIDKDKDSDLENVSFYFKDLATGHWTGINDNYAYNPASLMKVSLMITYYHKADESPDILKKKVKYEPYAGTQADTVAVSNLKVGQLYTIEELIEAMIIDSDNGAMTTLLSEIDLDSFSEVFSDFGISNPKDPKPEGYLISPKTYTLFFRVLYNSTYLSRQYSEKALELLSRATFKDGLIGGLPSDIKVAHKFGEYISNNPTDYELHDCGIVYYPQHDYLICVMTKGKDMDLLKKVIGDVSRGVYETIKSNYKN